MESEWPGTTPPGTGALSQRRKPRSSWCQRLILQIETISVFINIRHTTLNAQMQQPTEGPL